MSAINSETTEIPPTTPQINLHGQFFLNPTFLVFAFKCEDMLEFVGDDVVVDEGTVEKPLLLPMPLKEFEAVCKLLFDGDMQGSSFTPEELLDLYQGCRYLQYEEGLAWARRRYSIACFQVDPYEKLVQGIVLSEPSWITSSLCDSFHSGFLPLPTPKQGHILSDAGCSWVIMIVASANEVYKSNAADCLNTPPKPESSHTWYHHSCRNHQACLQAVETGWKMVRKRMPSDICPPQGVYCLLSFREYLSAAPFPRMHNECCASFIEDVSSRAEALHEDIILAVASKIEQIADKEAQRARARKAATEKAAEKAMEK
ncbi:hypothetical protein VNI00_014209 [Paramarasmius palmivorus]|uniref:BTB domain-containing protein n=1 Tax=Paramarasmius palmivorus TaxID=297713 RepID=A0AAW0BT51_9AGAR